MDVWLVMGSALYWAAVGFLYLEPAASDFDAIGLWTSAAKYAFLVVMIVCVYGVMRGMGIRRGRRVIACAVLIASLVLEVVAMRDGWRQAGLLHIGLEFFVIGSFMILWGLAFASFDKQKAAQNVVATILLAVLVLVGGFAISEWVPLSQLTYGLYGASAIIILVGRVPCANHRRKTVGGQRSHKAVSAAQRLAFGVVLGFSNQVAWLAEALVPGGFFMGLSAAIVVACLVLTLRAPDGLYTVLPALLLVAVGALYLPFFEGGLPSAVWANAGVVWIAWSAFSAVQLSDLKESYGMSELDVCLADKLLLALGFLGGGCLWAVLSVLAAGFDVSRANGLCVFSTTVVLVLGSVYSVARLVGARHEDAVRDELARTRGEREEEVYDRLAREAALSKREREVMKMLAKGYTSVYICEELGVSAGTAKAHVSHIYQKLGIHRKDELLRLIEERLGGA